MPERRYQGGKNPAHNFPEIVCFFTHPSFSARFLPSPVLFPFTNPVARKANGGESLYRRGKSSAPVPHAPTLPAQNNRSIPSPSITALAQNLLKEKAQSEIITAAIGLDNRPALVIASAHTKEHQERRKAPKIW
jgi:hypothetical protein